MRNLIKQFSDKYATDMDKQIYSEDKQRNFHHPIVFLFVGDKALDALNTIYELNERKWNNSAGVLYFHVYSNETTQRKNVYSLQISESAADKKQMRKNLYKQFYNNEDGLIEANRMMRKVSNRISEMGKMYTSFERINVSVVTRVDDPLNVLLPEITLLMKSVFSESFRIVNLDLYGLINEKTAGEDTAFSSSLGVSFLRELDYYQAKDYRFCEMLQVTEDYIKLAVEHTPSPLFDLVYLLSDKDERGMFVEHSMETNYEIVCSLNLLKNRKTTTDYSEKNPMYNNIQFKRNIQSESERSVYVSAGFSEVKRPDRTIALTVLFHFYEKFISRMKECRNIEKDQMCKLFELDDDSLNKKLRSFIPTIHKIEEMTSLMPMRASYSELKKMTLKQAEERLYGDAGQSFYEKNVVHIARSTIEQQAEFAAQVKQLIYSRMIENPKYGLYSAYFWTLEEHSKQSIFEELRKIRKETVRQIEEARMELEDFYQEKVEQQDFPKSFLPFMDKANMKNFIRHFFGKIYGKKTEILLLEIKHEVVKTYECILEDVHVEVAKQVAELKELEALLSSVSQDSLLRANGDLDRNISQYYEAIVEKVVQDLEAKRGTQFYFEERFIGNPAMLLHDGIPALVKRLIEVCHKDILSCPQFHQSFEDELLQRANVATTYDNRHVLSKEELFKELYRILEEDATVHIDVYRYTHKHRYEEKYFFGDFDSDFIRYAFEHDYGSRTYKLGCVHEKRSSGIEKLNIMGGFHMEDVMFFRNGKKYYHSYIENGFEFHGIHEQHLLPLQFN